MTNLEYRSPFRDRVYKRKFDHDLARKRFSDGESMSAIARSMGVSLTAVSRVINPQTSANMDHATRLWRLSHPDIQYDTCSCGNRKRSKSQVCRECYESQLPEMVSPDGQLWCSACSTYRPTDDFPFHDGIPSRGFKGRRCRSCDTKARRDYRNRHKVPCVGCGAPALPPSEKGTRAADFPRCRSCFLEDQRRKRAATREGGDT